MTAASRALLPLIAAGCAAAPPRAPSPAAWPAQSPFVVRPFSPIADGRWIGNGICYGPHRDGQSPEGASPSREQLREDLLLLAPRWRLLRMYNPDAPAENVLALVRAENLPIKVVLGAWIAPETKGPGGEALPAARAANRAQVENAVRLAEAYPGVVVALDVGNETQISWSDHRVPAALLIEYLREARARSTVPVTTADDFGYWVTPESRALAQEIDFLDVHAYAMWAGRPLEDALAFTRAKLAEVAQAHPDRALVLGEFGWATKRHSEGEQAKLIKGAAGEDEQRAFYLQAMEWTTRERVPNFWFEAFDENWKGGPHPDEVEKHWGLFRADRTPKKGMAGRE